MTTATITRPTVAQIDYREEGREVTAVLLEDGAVALTLDAGTAATILGLLRDAATDGDVTYRQAERAEVPAHFLAYLGNKATRARTVVDAVDLARVRAGVAGVTYDLD